jgi:hypothetical protein
VNNKMWIHIIVQGIYQVEAYPLHMTWQSHYGLYILSVCVLTDLETVIKS